MKLKLKQKRMYKMAMLMMLILGFAVGCRGENRQSDSVGDNAAESGTASQKTSDNDKMPSDYADEENWAMIPQNPDRPVDVFILYPTKYSGKEPVSTIDDETMRKGALTWYDSTGSAFETVGNIYMPFYRQMNVTALLGTPKGERDSVVANSQNGIDCIAAFEYYLEHYNNGRPFILFGHSQGAMMLKQILFGYFSKHPDIAKNMVAAYVTGYSVTSDDMKRNPGIKFAQGADDTGVVASWNTIAPDAETENLEVLLPGSLAINPISWTCTEEPADKSQNLGSFLDGKKVLNIADARVDTKLGAVICGADKSYATPDSASHMFGTGSFHGRDITFYYYNIRENAKNRITNFLRK